MVNQGDEIEEGELIAEVESEKAVVEIEATEHGFLRHIYAPELTTLTTGDPLGIVAGEEEDIAALADEAETALEDTDLEIDPATHVEESSAVVEDSMVDDQRSAVAEDSTVDDQRSAVVEVTTVDNESDTNRHQVSPRARQLAEDLSINLDDIDMAGIDTPVTSGDIESLAPKNGETTEIKATPPARRRASELNIDLTGIEGSGPKGAITTADIGKNEPEPTTDSRTEERQLSGMRRTIIDRLGKSYREAIHVTVHRKVNAESLLTTTETVNQELDIDISIQDLLVLAVSSTLEQHPAFNATFEEESHYIHETQDIAVAVDVDEGLVTPVLRGVENKLIDEIAIERRDLTDRVLDGDYTMEEIQGGTFTISNLGPLGVESFNPVINPPQIAILGVNALTKQPVDDNGEIVLHDHLPLDLSFDHRIIDGADAARFLDTLAGHLTNPLALLLGSVTGATERRQ
jgi:pyruvate dehydrogenase E2 component (dihydrolipoamide acetyltransferase)